MLSSQDCGTHTLFIAEVTAAKVLSSEPSLTYRYYFDHVKPKPLPAAMTEEAKVGWICKICGFIYENDNLPADYICPICKHGAADFEKIAPAAETAPAPKKKTWVCKICGYVYEGDALPADYVCPLCKHGASDFVLQA